MVDRLEEILGILRNIEESDTGHCDGYTYLRIPHESKKELLKISEIDRFKEYNETPYSLPDED